MIRGHDGPVRVDFTALARRLRVAAGALGLLAAAGALTEMVLAGPGLSVLTRWGTGLAAAVVLTAALLAAAQAARTAGDVSRRGERLAGDDVRLVPPRREQRLFGDDE
jgi:hypothetical protein